MYVYVAWVWMAYNGLFVRSFVRSFIHSIFVLILDPFCPQSLFSLSFSLLSYTKFTTRHLQYAQNILLYATWHNKMHGSCSTSNVLFADLLCAMVACLPWRANSRGMTLLLLLLLLLIRWPYLPRYTIWHQNGTSRNDLKWHKPKSRMFSGHLFYWFLCILFDLIKSWTNRFYNTQTHTHTYRLRCRRRRGPPPICYHPFCWHI